MRYTSPPVVKSPMATPHRRRLRYLVTMHPFIGIAALAPHVGEALSQHLGGVHVHWMLPTLPAGCRSTCWEGFAVQGK